MKKILKFVILGMVLALCLGALSACQQTHVHDYKTVVTNPTCEEKGYTTYTCSCNDSYVADYVNATGHSFGSYTSNNDGTKTATCTCGKSNRIADETVLIVSNGAVKGLTDYGKTLKDLAIPGDVTGIDENAFLNNTVLESIEIEASVISIGKSAFQGCESLKKVSYTGTVENWAQIQFAAPSSNPLFYGAELYIRSEVVKNVVLKDVTSIGDFAFYAYQFLESIEIPNSVTYVGSRPFEFCNALNCNEKDGLKYLGNPENPYLYLVGGGIKMVADTETTTATIDSNCKFIGSGAFFSWFELETLVLPDGITDISDYAFAYCYKLKQMTIPAGVTNISAYAFHYCSALERVTVPASVTTIGDYAFFACDALTIYCEAAAQQAGWSDTWNALDRPVVWNNTAQN